VTLKQKDGVKSADLPLCILAGSGAWQRIERDGLSASIFGALVGASGGAKMLGITHLDRYLFGNYLQQSSQPLELYGSSIGSWRHAALTAADPLAAVIELQERYLNQKWDENDRRSAGEIVDELCDWVVDGFCTSELLNQLCHHPRFTSHIITARGRGLNSLANKIGLGIGMGVSAIGNAISREILAAGFQRVVFSSGPASTFRFDDFSTQHVTLTAKIVKQALLASGSIPFLMSGQRDIEGAPAGHYWDGGIIDYHFDFSNHVTDALVLYPHFSEQVITGWFDKKLPWRRNPAAMLDRTVILAPSAAYLGRLPNGRFPDRNDFRRFSQAQRIRYWQKAMAMSQELADAFDLVVNSHDPLAYITRLEN